MRVYSPQLGLAPASILGGEVFDRQVLLGLAKKGANIEIILPKGKTHDPNIKNWHISYLPFSRFPAILANILFIVPSLNLYKNRPFQIMRLHQPQFFLIPAILLKVLNSNIKLIATYHQFRETNFGPFSKLINNFWDHIICDSHNVKEQIAKIYKVPKSKISVVHNGVPTYLKNSPKDKKLSAKLKLEDKVVLLFMGLFIDRKNPLFLLEVLSHLVKSRYEIVLIFWGKGPLHDEIKNRARQLNLLKNIRIVPPIFGEEKNKIHNLADIFVHPARDEGFALAPLEAMACGKPVVITRGYSAGEAVEDGINGYLCHYNDTNHWSQKLYKLIVNSDLRKRMDKTSLAKVKNEFQWELAVKKHLIVFEELAK